MSEYEERLEKIRKRATDEGEHEWGWYTDDVPFLLEWIDSTRSRLDHIQKVNEYLAEHDSELRVRAETAEANVTSLEIDVKRLDEGLVRALEDGERAESERDAAIEAGIQFERAYNSQMDRVVAEREAARAEIERLTPQAQMVERLGAEAAALHKGLDDAGIALHAMEAERNAVLRDWQITLGDFQRCEVERDAYREGLESIRRVAAIEKLDWLVQGCDTVLAGSQEALDGS